MTPITNLTYSEQAPKETNSLPFTCMKFDGDWKKCEDPVPDF
jgi:hypothetical protein